MQNKTVANWQIAGLASCVVAVVLDDSTILGLAGLFLIITSIIMAVRLSKFNGWLQQSFYWSLIATIFLSFFGAKDELVGLAAVCLWVFSIMAIVKLYKTK